MKARIKSVIKKATNRKAPLAPLEHWIDVVVKNAPGSSKDLSDRVKTTISCGDSAYIPKVKDAGKVKTVKGKKYQIMHNGMIVEADGYYGDWTTEIVAALKGHHEPQEEKVFYELLKRVPSGGTMIELGAYWSYYSIWFNMAVKNATNYVCEPDPVNRELGKRNAAANLRQNMHFIAAAAGSNDGELISFLPQEGNRAAVEVPIRTIDGLAKEYGIKRFEVVHMDVQGHELAALVGAEESIKAGMVRFAVISTHHYCISGDPLLHEKCLNKVKELGGHIVVEHAIHESYSGDGLIVVSFDQADKDFTVSVSENRMQDSAFRAYNADLVILAEAYEAARNR